jgi:hypothetical protein
LTPVGLKLYGGKQTHEKAFSQSFWRMLCIMFLLSDQTMFKFKN